MTIRALLVAIAVMALAVGAGAVTMDSELVAGAAALPFAGTTIPLHAEATWTAGVWTYTYTLQITNSTRPITGFSVGNLNRLQWYDATNDKNFVNPTDWTTDSVFWSGGSVPTTDGPITFMYKSRYGPTVVPTSLFGGARSADGFTLGLAVPEPGSLSALGALALAGFAGFRRRRA